MKKMDSAAAAVASTVVVAVRIRPLSREESLEGAPGGGGYHLSNMIQVSADNTTIHLCDLGTGGGGGNSSSSNSLGLCNSSSSGVRHAFTFDQVFSSAPPSGRLSTAVSSPVAVAAADAAAAAPRDNQVAVYRFFGPVLCKHVLEGYNACLFAYGQTGSGKTYSMIGKMITTNAPADSTTLGSSCVGEQAGIIPRLCEALFQRMKDEREADPTVTHRVECSFVEIYCEKVRDLLPSPAGSSSTSLRVRQHPTRGPYVEGAQLLSVTDVVSVMRLLQLGMKERATAETKMNDQSSRSHAILQLHVTRVEVVRDASASVVTKTRSSKVNLIDLAGSERVNQSGATGDRLEEAKNINLSLHCLGRVIQVLADRSSSSSSTTTTSPSSAALGSALPSRSSDSSSTPPSSPSLLIPAYRESVLTWLLSDSLGGNSKTFMLATVSPTAACYSQTVNTLRFACVAKRVVNIASVNEDSHFHKLVSDLREQILRLTVQLEQKERRVEPREEEKAATAAAKKMAAEAEGLLRQERAVSADYLDKIQCLEMQVRDQHQQLRMLRDVEEHATKLKRDLDATREQLSERTMQMEQLQQCIASSSNGVSGGRSNSSPLSSSSRSGSTTASTSPQEVSEALISELQQQLEDVSLQLQVAICRRQEADVGRVETQARMDRTVSELKQLEAQRLKLISELSKQEQELASLRARVGQPRDDACQAALEARVAQQAVLLSQTRASHEDDIKTMGMQRQDIIELEQLLLEETESSQRYVLTSYCEGQMFQLFRSMTRGVARLNAEANAKRLSAMKQANLTILNVTAHESADRLAMTTSAFSSDDFFVRTAREETEARMRLKFQDETRNMLEERQSLVRERRALQSEISVSNNSLCKMSAAKEKALEEVQRLTAENVRLFGMVSELQTQLEDARREAGEIQTALSAADSALQSQQQQRLFEIALEEDVDGLRGTLTELEKENEYVHATNSTMTSRYDCVIKRLREDLRQARLETEKEIMDREEVFQREATHQKSRLSELESCNERLEEQVETLRHELDEARRIINTVREEEELTRQLSLQQSSTSSSSRSALKDMQPNNNNNEVHHVALKQQQQGEARGREERV